MRGNDADVAAFLVFGAPIIAFMASWVIAFGFAYFLLWLKGGDFAFGAFMIRAVVTWVVLLIASPAILGAWAWFAFVAAVGSGCVNC